jgi:hypothetical protein
MSKLGDLSSGGSVGTMPVPSSSGPTMTPAGAATLSRDALIDALRRISASPEIQSGGDAFDFLCAQLRNHPVLAMDTRLNVALRHAMQAVRRREEVVEQIEGCLVRLPA